MKVFIHHNNLITSFIVQLFLSVILVTFVVMAGQLVLQFLLFLPLLAAWIGGVFCLIAAYRKTVTVNACGVEIKKTFRTKHYSYSEYYVFLEQIKYPFFDRPVLWKSKYVYLVVVKIGEERCTDHIELHIPQRISMKLFDQLIQYSETCVRADQ